MHPVLQQLSMIILKEGKVVLIKVNIESSTYAGGSHILDLNHVSTNVVSVAIILNLRDFKLAALGQSSESV